MNAIIPPKRRDGRSSFMQLVAYIAVRDDVPLANELKEDQRFKRPSRSRQAVFNRLVDYMSRSEGNDPEEVMSMSADGDIRSSVDGVVCQHNMMSVGTAASEMNSIAMQNKRVVDPVYHYILSWQEGENLTDDQIFDSVKHSLSRLGMDGHQYVASIHRDTDNLHVHIAANRVNPQTFRAVNIWNDADKLQRSCRELELKHGFKVDNGSWVRNENNDIVRAKFGYKKAPRGAATLEHFGDRESLHTFAVSHCRKDINAMFRSQSVTWEGIHEVFNKAGLKLERQGEGLVIRDAFNPSNRPIKGSRLHSAMTLSRLQPKLGQFVPSTTDDVVFQQKIVHPAYNDLLHVRDKAARQERRLERAAARQDLRDRYQQYKSSWVKPDLGAKERFKAISDAFREQKQRVRSGESDPLMRKLMYHVVEFEREKSMAALRIQLKAERQALFEEGKLRPMNYRSWTEQQAMSGDKAAISQLRGWAYREARKHRTPVEADTLIFCAPADDTPLLKADGYEVRLHRDGAAVYSRHGQDAIIDRGDSVEVRNPYAEDDLNTKTAIDMVSWKSGERMEFSQSGPFPYAAGDAVADHNLLFRDNIIVPTNPVQFDYTLASYERKKADIQDREVYDDRERWAADDAPDVRRSNNTTYKP